MAKKSTADGLKNLKQQFQTGDYKNVYLFFGEEDFLRSYYFGMLKSKLVNPDFADFNYVVMEGARQDFNEITIALDTPPMMADKKMVLIKYSGVFSKAGEEAKKYWSNAIAKVPDYVVLVFYEDEVDKRSVLYKAVAKAGETVECAYLEGVELINWVGRGCREAGKAITKADIEHLIRSCDGGMNNLKRELEKLFAYCGDRITKADIDRIVTKMPQSRVFEMINAMLRHDARTVFLQLEELKTLKESAFMVLALLLTNFERIFHTKILLERSEPYGNIAAKIKVPPYFVRDYATAAGSFDKAFLRRAIAEIAEIDFSIKQGRVEDWMGVENFLAKCLA